MQYEYNYYLLINIIILKAFHFVVLLTYHITLSYTFLMSDCPCLREAILRVKYQRSVQVCEYHTIVLRQRGSNNIFFFAPFITFFSGDELLIHSYVYSLFSSLSSCLELDGLDTIQERIIQQLDSRTKSRKDKFSRLFSYLKKTQKIWQ